MTTHYITRRGYTVKKENMSEKEIEKIRNELHVQPFEKQRYIMEKFGPLPPSFKVYLESVAKFYIPRYYGLSTFGPAVDKIGDAGIPIDLTFHGTLRDYQKNLMKEFLPKFREQKGAF